MGRGHTRTLAATAFLLLGSAHVAQAAKYLAQAPCTPVSSSYYTFFYGAGSPPPPTVTVRNFTFNLPAAGSVFVQFNGSLLCTNYNATDGVVDAITQIRTDSAAADANGAGSQRYSMTLKNSDRNTLTTTFTFNMASSRVITYSSGGSKAVRLMLTPLRMDKSTFCGVVNASFSVALP
ncbi:MAG: hypothetical protein U1E45_19440 [Geminicoccaceae bacterium]